MRQLHDDLWIAESPLRFMGLEMGARMTLVRLPGPRVLVHSPIAVGEELLAAVRAIGPVEHLIAPNRLHHLFAGDWKRALPDAALWVAPGLETKRSDLEIAGVLGDEPEPAWKGVLEQVVLRGIPFTNEVVFFHRPSATLIAADLAFNIGASSPLLTRWFMRLNGTYGELAPTFLERLMVRDRAAFRRSLEHILAWPFERAVVAHGDVCERGAKEKLVRGYAWALA